MLTTKVARHGLGARLAAASLALALVLAACNGSKDDSEDAAAAPAADAVAPEGERSDLGLPPLLNVDLSDAAVDEMTLGELWTIGVVMLDWPAEMPEDATKEGVHQRLLRIKFHNAGDWTGYVDSGSGYIDDE